MLIFVSTGCAKGDWIAADWGDAEGLQRSNQSSGSPGSTQGSLAPGEKGEPGEEGELPGPDGSIPEASGAPSSTGGSSEPQGDDSQSSQDNSGEGEPEEEPELPAPVEKTLSLGDVELVISLSKDRKQLKLHYKVSDGEVDGEATKMKDFQLDELAIEVPSVLYRSKDASSEYEKLCVGPGESMFYLPHDSESAQDQESPSLSWRNSIHRNLLHGDRVYVQVLAVERLGGGQSDFSVWSPGKKPKFAYSSCKSKTKDYGIRIVGGFRSGFNLGFAGSAGYWKVELEAYLKLASSRRPRKKQVSLFFKVG